MGENNPIVFISYSHDSKDHQDKVLKLSDKLRSEGIDCILDQYEDSPPEGWPKWMDRNIKKSDFVLIICTEIYYNRVIGADDAGLGIKWESNLIYQHLYNAGANNTKFIPVKFETGDNKFIPDPLQSATYYNVDDNDEFDSLYWRLRGVNTKKAELGKLRELPEKERKTIFISDISSNEIWDKSGWCGVAFILDKEGELPPRLGLLFRNRNFASTIFENWKKIIGANDKFDELRISIIEGDVKGEDNGYYIHIGCNPISVFKMMDSNYKDLSIDYFIHTSKITRVFVPKDSNDLKLFKEHLKIFGHCYLTPVIIDDQEQTEILTKYNIYKKNIIFRNYDEINSKHDLDFVVKK